MIVNNENLTINIILRGKIKTTYIYQSKCELKRLLKKRVFLKNN